MEQQQQPASIQQMSKRIINQCENETIRQVLTSFNYPPPPLHYKQATSQPPQLNIYKKYTEGISSFGVLFQGTQISAWSQFDEMKFKPYDQNFKNELKNLNNSIYSKMKIALQLIFEKERPQQLKELIMDIQKYISQFFSICKTIKEFQTRRQIYENCKKQALKYELLSEKYGDILQNSKMQLLKIAQSTPISRLMQQE